MIEIIETLSGVCFLASLVFAGLFALYGGRRG